MLQELTRILDNYWIIAWFVSILYVIMPFYILSIHGRLGKLMKLMDSRNENLHVRIKIGECKHCRKEKQKGSVCCPYCYNIFKEIETSDIEEIVSKRRKIWDKNKKHYWGK